MVEMKQFEDPKSNKINVGILPTKIRLVVTFLVV